MSALFQIHAISGVTGNGPKLLITAGVHGDEYEGMEAIRKLIDAIDSKELQGHLTLVPVINESAFALRSRTGKDGLDLARTCPGNMKGSITERVACQLSQLIQDSDYYIDLHTGGEVVQVDPLVGYNLVSDSSVLNIQRRMAHAFGLPIIWGTSADLEGRSLSVARDAKVPAIYAEYLGGGGCSSRGVKAYVKGCFNVMAELNMIDSRLLPIEPKMVVEDPRPNSGHMQICHPSPTNGYFETMVTLGQNVTQGQILGHVVDPLKSSNQPILAQHTGRILVLRTCPSVKEGDSLTVILETEAT